MFLGLQRQILVFYQNLRSIWLLFSIMFSLLVFLFIIELYAQMNKLPRWTTFYSFSLSLTSCIFSSNIISDDHYIYHIVLTSYGFRIVAYCIHNFHTQPHIENGVTIGQKIAVNLVVNHVRKFQKFTVSSISCFGDTAIEK